MPALSGSYEELLHRGQQMAANRNEEAIAIYEKLMARIGAMPKAQRMAHDGRLQAIFEQAAINAQSFLNILERYDDAIEVMGKLRAAVEPGSYREIDAHTAEILLMAGRTDEAATMLRTIVEGEDGDLLDFGALCLLFLRQDDYASAQAVVHEMVEWIGSQHDDGSANPAAYLRDLAYLNNVRSIVATAQERWAEGIQYFEEAAAGDDYFAQNPHLLYTRLIRGGRYAEALPYIDEDTSRTIRPNFWRGIALSHLGDGPKAKQLWQEVTETELSEQEGDSFSDVILAFYYLGDPERMGLELALRLLSEVRNPSWSAFFLAGLGWAIHDSADYARHNLEIALQQRRAAAEGTRLAQDVNIFVRDLLSEEMQALFAEFIEEPATHFKTQVSADDAS